MTSTSIQRSIFLAAAFALVSGFAADARADDVDLELRSSVLKGKERPALILRVNRAVATAAIDFVRDDGKRIRKKSGRLRVGAVYEFLLDAPVGKTGFTGKLDIVFVDGKKGSIPLQLEVEVVAGFGIEVPVERVDIAKGELELKLTRAAGYCDHEVLIENKPTRVGVTRFAGEPAGSYLKIRWDPYDSDDLTLRVTLRCFDADEIFETGIELYPWKIEIPHEDVIFASAKWDVKPRQAPKLVAAQAEIAAAVQRYGRWIKGVKLFVAGHTDTVGTKDYNRDLSLKRARSIARYFRKIGVRVSILYAGFGEEIQAVPTPDETAHEENRRAEYIISVTEPRSGDWREL